jgi:hypothetical protein
MTDRYIYKTIQIYTNNYVYKNIHQKSYIYMTQIYINNYTYIKGYKYP